MQPFSPGDDIIRHGEQVDDVKIETADISNKFKFFESYKPAEHERKQFRITPPREGVAPSQENGNLNGATETNGVGGTNGVNGDHHYADASAKAAQRSHTTTKMLSMFRQMEEAERAPQHADGELKPLKCFTPPPDDNRRVQNRNSESENDCTDSEEEDDDDVDDEENDQRTRNVDEALQQAQAAARAKQLRAKFERWETKEIQREQNNAVQLFDGDDQSQTESAKV